MKIYFEDSCLRTPKLKESFYYIVDAASGVSSNIAFLDELLERQKDCVVYTNSLMAFSNRYAWNVEKEIPEIYIRNKNDEFTNITHMTSRYLKEGMNLARLYIAGEFMV